MLGQVHSSHMPNGFAPGKTKPVKTMSVKTANAEIKQMQRDAMLYGSKGAFRVVTRSTPGKMADPATIKKANWDALFKEFGTEVKKGKKRFPEKGFGIKQGK
jgi:hypothetical protein